MRNHLVLFGCSATVSSQNHSSRFPVPEAVIACEPEQQLRVFSPLLPLAAHRWFGVFADDAGTVPTAPPQNVQVEAVNSTTIRFLWKPPPQQFIHGINQGYKVRGLGAAVPACCGPVVSEEATLPTRASLVGPPEPARSPPQLHWLRNTGGLSPGKAHASSSFS